MNVIQIGSMVRWVQLTVLLAIAALLANSQCYARCLLSMPGQASSQSDSGCHHSSPSKHGNQSQCDYQHHSVTANSEAKVDLPTVSVLSFFPLTIVTTASAVSSHARSVLTNLLAERASPPDKPLFLAISVLRL